MTDLDLIVDPGEVEEFDRAYREAREAELGRPIEERWVDGKLVVWAPQEGSQTEFLECPLFEALYHGTRGSGKTDALLMAFARFVDRGFGESWRGIIFRETYPQLADVVAKSERWFRRIFPGARFNRARMAWEWPTGEVLLFRHMRNPDDYWNYHGHEYPFIGWEELTNWSDDRCYKPMFACCRSSNPDVPRMVRATTNPHGKGHNWVRDRFRLGSRWWETKVVLDSKDLDGDDEPPRAAVFGQLSENRILLKADPNYEKNVMAAATSKAMAEAWKRGRWDVVAGGMFDDVWDPNSNDVPEFVIPQTWTIDRAFDWGSSRPFSVGWYAQSDGGDLTFPDGRIMATVRGDLFRVREWYGFTGRPNEGLRMLATEVARGIVEREIAWGWREIGRPDSRVRPGPADSAIYAVENGRSIGLDMEQPVRLGEIVYPGIQWTRADKAPGSRVSGWEAMRTWLKSARRRPGVARERPGLFVVGKRCPQWLRTVLTLPRDEKNPDDVDTDAEDHPADETRYRVRSGFSGPSSGLTVGLT